MNQGTALVGIAYPFGAVPGFVHVLMWDSCYSFVKLHVFKFLVPCCDVRYDFRVKTMLGSSLFPFVLSRVHVLFMLSVFIYVYWWPTQFPCQKIFVSFNSTTTTEQQLLTLPEFAPGFSEVRVAQSFGFCVVSCR